MIEFVKNKKSLWILVVGAVFVVGVVCLCYFKGNGDNGVNVDSFMVGGDGSEETGGGISGVGSSAGGESENGGSGDSSTGGKNGAEGQEVICVHIIGEVQCQGIIKLAKGQRIVDAIEAAGGVTDLADLSKVNLAYVLSDGQKVRIPSVNDKEDDAQYIVSGCDGRVLLDAGNSAVGGGMAGKVNINTANQTELETLSGIGPSIAAKIIQYREKNGKFRKVEDLKNVSGIGESKFESLKGEVEV